MKFGRILERIIDRLTGRTALEREHQRFLAELRLDLARTPLGQDEKSVVIAFNARGRVISRELDLSQISAASMLGLDETKAACTALVRRGLLISATCTQPADTGYMFATYRFKDIALQAYLRNASTSVQQNPRRRP